MTRAPLLAAAAGILAVLGAWEALGAAEAELRGGLGRAVGLIRRTGTEGATPSTAERRRAALLLAGVCFAGGWLVAGPVSGAALAGCAPAALGALVRRRQRRWRSALARGAPGAARALADAVGAGHSVRGALAEAGRHVSGAVGAELRVTAQALALGARTEDEVERLRARAGGEAWDTVTAAVLLQREAGGDLASLLRRIADAQEDAARLERDARSATAQARFTGLIVCGLPLGALGLTLLVAPGAVAGMLRAPASALLGGLAIALQLGSLAAIGRLARLPE